MKKCCLFISVIIATLCLAFATYAEEDGWVKEGTHYCYYKEGTKVTGLQTIEGEDYEFTDDGYLKGNGQIRVIYVPFAYTHVYINADNEIATGWQTINGDKYYFNSILGNAVDGVNTIDGVIYVFGDDRKLVTNDWYWSHYADNTGRSLIGYQTIGEHKYFFDENGCALYGIQDVNGEKHYFSELYSPEYYYEAYGWVHDRNTGALYYFDHETGVMQTSSRTIDGKKYEFNTDGTLRHNGPVVLKFDDGLWYGFSADNQAISGWQVIDGEKYYFGLGNTAVTDLKYIDEEYYFFNEEGKLQTDKFIWTKNDELNMSGIKNLYYFGPDGKRLMGWQTINGSVYFFDGWSGMYVGHEYINMNGYFFDEEGRMQKNCFQKCIRVYWEGVEYLYYFGPDGKQLVGWQTINGDTYYFDYHYGAQTGTVTIDDKTYHFTEDGKLIVPPDAVALNKAEITVVEGKTVQLTATVNPSNAANKKVKWSSDKPGVAKVDADGLITGMSAGTAKITVTTEEGGKTATCTVTVSSATPASVPVTGVTLNKSSLSLTEGDKGTLAASVAPSNATNRNVSWSSSNNSVATVDANGTVAAVAFGKATITVTTEDGKKTANCTVTVEPKDKVTGYVVRCYSIILGRDPDAGGLKTWYNELISGRKAASEIIDNFVRSQEFLGKNYSNADAVEILYKAMLGRGSDPAGKADWVGKLDAGHPFAVVINGFCGSKEFKEICDSYGIAPGSVSMEQGSASDQQIRAFVTRCYKIILGRDADEVGMNTWFNELKSRRRTAAEIIEQFVYSQEFQNKKYSNPDAVEILYKAMLGRGSDPAGKADWVGRLAGGQPLTAVINGFCGSTEFTTICNTYGITPGSVKVENVSRAAEEPTEEIVRKSEQKANLIEITNPSDTVNEQLGTAVQAIYINEEKAKGFIGRCYRAILGREAGDAELDSWIGQMTNGSKTADQIARGFLFSGEFKDKNVSNEELVKILYRVYLNREADAEGLATWMQKLDEGTGLNDLLNAFAKTNEFKAVVRAMSN